MLIVSDEPVDEDAYFVGRKSIRPNATVTHFFKPKVAKQQIVEQKKVTVVSQTFLNALSDWFKSNANYFMEKYSKL